MRVPACNLDLVGVRDVVDKDGLEKVFDILRAEHVEEPTNWSRRYKANLEKLHSGDVMKVSEVVRDLWRRERDRGLSAGEKRMLAKARQILVPSSPWPSTPTRTRPRPCSTRSSPAEPRSLSNVEPPGPCPGGLHGLAYVNGMEDQPAALGAVIEQGRGSLPFTLIHGEALVACAAWGLGESGVTPVDLGTEWAGLVDGGEPFVIHDSLCPMTPGSFIAECLVRAVESDTVVVGVRPVTDTVKVVRHGVSARPSTVRRCGPWLAGRCCPPRVVAELDALPALDFAELVAVLEAGSGSSTSRRRRRRGGSRRRRTWRLLEALTQPLR